MKQPDPKLHFQVSMGKSALRIVACVGLIMGLPVFCGVVLILAEIVGILEEMV